jgi:asparagine synthase (glutamine-hydrolysing)
MFRYIAIQWNCLDETQSTLAHFLIGQAGERIPEFAMVFQARGLCVFATRSGPTRNREYRISGNGVILGTVFRKTANNSLHSTAESTEFNDRISNQIVATSGRCLITHYWGSYVAFVCPPEGAQQSVIRAPMGSLPCYVVTDARGIHIYFSFAEDAIGLDVLPFSVNWDYIAAYISLPKIFSEATALDRVRMLLPGECRHFDNGKTSHCLYWNPCEIAESDQIFDTAEAVQTLRRSVLSCAGAWVTGHDSILHLLSGGVDSSIALASLAQAVGRPRITCVNMYVENTAADERRFARLAAGRMGCELVEAEMPSDINLRDTLKASRTVNPIWAFQSVANSEYLISVARRVGATAMSSAICGDQLFLTGPTIPAAAEFLQLQGLRWEFLRVARICARLDSVSLHGVLLGAFRDAWFKTFDARWRPLKEIRLAGAGLVDEAAATAAKDDLRFYNPWLRSATRIPVGKRWQIFLLSFDDFYYDSLTTKRYPERIDVTVSQPVADICLRIPTYVHISNGWSRGVARQAFAEDLPSEIRTRVTKGNPMRWASRQVRSNLPFLRELLLDGELVARGLLNRVKVEEALSDDFRKNAYDVTRLFDAVNVETWLAVWKGSSAPLMCGQHHQAR